MVSPWPSIGSAGVRRDSHSLPLVPIAQLSLLGPQGRSLDSTLGDDVLVTYYQRWMINYDKLTNTDSHLEISYCCACWSWGQFAACCQVLCQGQLFSIGALGCAAAQQSVAGSCNVAGSVQECSASQAYDAADFVELQCKWWGEKHGGNMFTKGTYLKNWVCDDFLLDLAGWYRIPRIMALSFIRLLCSVVLESIVRLHVPFQKGEAKLWKCLRSWWFDVLPLVWSNPIVIQ